MCTTLSVRMLLEADLRMMCALGVPAFSCGRCTAALKDPLLKGVTSGKWLQQWVSSQASSLWYEVLSIVFSHHTHFFLKFFSGLFLF